MPAMHLSVCLSACLSVSLSVCLSVCLAGCLSVCLSVCLYVCLSVCLSPSVHLSVILTSPLKLSVHNKRRSSFTSYTERSRIFEQTDPKLAQSRVVIYRKLDILTG